MEGSFSPVSCSSYTFYLPYTFYLNSALPCSPPSCSSLSPTPSISCAAQSGDELSCPASATAEPVAARPPTALDGTQGGG